jgi:hypothetical protein
MPSGTAVEIVKGCATFVVPQSMLRRRTGGTTTARYCYSVFLRHLVMMKRYGATTAPLRVAEIGPGDSIGTGLAALLAGAERYDGFDVKAYNSNEQTRALFEELVALLEARASIPDNTELPQVHPHLESYAFPADILTDARLARSLAPERIERIRRDLRDPQPTGGMVGYVAPWHGAAAIEPGAVDWIFSQAVMEHVDALQETYDACFAWLKPGGIMTHEIDFRSHGMTPDWNGHWGWSDVTWRLIRGARPWLFNREPYSSHASAMRRAGFVIKGQQAATRDDGIGRRRLAARFRAMSDDDLRTSTAFVVAGKPAHA